MKDAWAVFSKAYLRIDPRVLGLFRVAHGLVLFYDLARRSSVLESFYSNAGVLSNHYVLFRPQADFQFSLLTAFSTLSEVRFAFALIALVYALYTLGLCTRLAQVLALVSLTSLNSRNLFLEDAGVSTLILLGLWTIFLPVGARFSLDALRAEARAPTLAERVRLRERSRSPVASLAVLALNLQLLAIYWLNARQKVGPTWQHGEALHYVLWQQRVATDFAVWLAQHEPPWLSPAATHGALFIEWLLPLLALSPIGVWPRVLAFVLALALHGGVALLMTLGPFSYAMLALVMLRLPWEAFAAIARRVPRRLGVAVLRARARLVRWLRASRFGRARRPLWQVDLSLLWRPPREGLVAILMIAAVFDMSAHNPGFPVKLRPPRWARSVTGYPRALQRWDMFAPDAPRDDGAGVIDALTASGRHVDPFTGLAPNFDVMERGPLPHGGIAADYLFSMHFDADSAYWPELRRYLAEWHEHGGRSADDRLVKFELWWLSRQSPEPGSSVPGPVRRQLIRSGP